MKLKDIGEHEFVRRFIVKYLDITKLEDVYISGNKGYKVDGFKLSYTFPFISYYDIGWKAITAVVSDLITKGVRPNIFLVSLGLNVNLEVEKSEELFKGLSDAIHYYKGKYVGGDLNDSDSNGWIDIFAEGDVVCNINGEIKTGDLVLATDKIGYTTNVFISYLNQFIIPILHKSLIKTKHPVVNRSLLYFIRRYCPYVKYSTDISDGLIVSLYNIISNIRLGIEISEFPIDENIFILLKKYLKMNKLDILKYSGEEFVSLFVVDRSSPLDSILSDLKYLGFNPIVFGKIIDNKAIVYKNQEIKITGWDNFLGWY
ncbi:MAG: AIR synthase related protein [Saccharolobus sp.]